MLAGVGVSSYLVFPGVPLTALTVCVGAGSFITGLVFASC